MLVSTVLEISLDHERRECARRLAAMHRRVYPTTEAIYLAPGEDGVVRLLEVVPELDLTGSIFPVGFPPDPEEEIELPSVVILVHPAEWKWLREGTLALPSEWGDLASLEQLS